MFKQEQFGRKGSAKVSRNAIVSITKNAVLETEGVYSLCAYPASIKEYFMANHTANAVKVNIINSSAEISVCIVVKYGFNILNLSEQLQENIKEAVQNMVGISVSKVNIYISDVKIGK